MRAKVDSLVSAAWARAGVASAPAVAAPIAPSPTIDATSRRVTIGINRFSVGRSSGSVLTRAPPAVKAQPIGCAERNLPGCWESHYEAQPVQGESPLACRPFWPQIGTGRLAVDEPLANRVRSGRKQP